jgi:peptidoglycan/LPS O-acetylase OafA/YrhL
MLALFLAWMMQTKDFDLAQALSQMAGLGLFTHGNNLINSPTWFVSVLLVCYVLSAIARATGHTTWVATGLGIAAMGLALWEEPDFIGMSFLAFGMGFLRARIQARRVFVVGSLAFLLGMCFMDGIPFVSLILAVLALESGLLMRSVSHVVQRASQFSYEYFLLHGLGLHAGLAMVPQTPLWGISVGVLLAILASVALHLLLARLGRTVQSLPIPLTVLGHRKHPRGFDTH